MKKKQEKYNVGFAEFSGTVSRWTAFALNVSGNGCECNFQVEYNDRIGLEVKYMNEYLLFHDFQRQRINSEFDYYFRLKCF
mgnify:CR=1 FL=1